MSEETYTVAPPEDRRRVLFEGSYDDAVAYMDANFPWPHSDGSREIHSAVLIAPDGKSHQTYHRSTGISEDSYDRDWNVITPEAAPVETEYVPPAEDDLLPPADNPELA